MVQRSGWQQGVLRQPGDQKQGGGFHEGEFSAMTSPSAKESLINLALSDDILMGLYSFFILAFV